MKKTRAKGNKDYTAYLAGKRLTLAQSIKAKCYECMGCYQDGVVDCEISSCPLYPFNPYSKAYKGIRQAKRAVLSSAGPSAVRLGN